MFSIDTKSIGIALALLILLAGVGFAWWYLKRILVERETCALALNEQNKSILAQNIATESYIENLEKNKEAIKRRYIAIKDDINLIRHKECTTERAELDKIKKALEVFKAKN
ncbi:hypothetical protein [Helicobacter suis]|uniref:hypothetical protein n=1 Tax=Helicobacter suis TaxID=104628 RepID=UPI0013D593FB|nr:hypothetical protein [Helicobacter suis]